ncbi:RNA polymerase rpc34 subunit domain-containing protein [Ditylenchus destructor]|nr:RNA polymerase rpc34 subunit domain-containing protein [Ditylenchus destructor]
MSYDKNLESQVEKQILDLLKDRRDGVSSDDLSKSTQEVDGLLRGHVVNKMLAANTIEMLQSKGSGTFLLRLKRGAQIDGSQEEQLVHSLIEEADKMGIWIRDIRDRSGLTDTQLRKVLKTLETRRLVKSVKAVGTTKKCYMLFNLEGDESLTGGTFYSDQQLDSQFVQTLAQVCIKYLQAKRRQVEESKTDPVAQRESSFVKSEDVAKYIMEKGICKINLGVGDVESILDVAVLDGDLEKRIDHTYRALKIRKKSTALATVPCLQCPVRFECRTGNVISPENCEYFKTYFDL